MSYVSIAIDGPAGAGKSTLSRSLAARLGYIYVDTGAIYRTIAYCAQRRGLDTKADAADVIDIAQHCRIDLEFIDGMQHVFLNGEDVTAHIRTPEVSKGASDVSAIPQVRAALLDLQRRFAQTNNVIMDGRDIGTCVLPDATVKIFLTASLEERAKRRYLELQEKGTVCDLETVKRDMAYRDRQDATREAAPLVPAPDAVVVDTGAYNFEQSLELLYQLVKERL